MIRNNEFINTKNITSISTQKDIIYYLYDYYKKWWVEKYPNNNNIRRNYYSFIMIKNNNYNIYKTSFSAHVAIKNFISKLEGEWIVCTAPGHEKTTNDYNSVYAIMMLNNYDANICFKNSLIQRAYTVEKKSTTTYGRVTDPLVDMQSLELNKLIDIKNKNILVVDDITTTGCTLTACRNLLLNAGAKNVVCLAIGKTKENMYYEY